MGRQGDFFPYPDAPCALIVQKIKILTRQKTTCSQRLKPAPGLHSGTLHAETLTPQGFQQILHFTYPSSLSCLSAEILIGSGFHVFFR